MIYLTQRLDTLTAPPQASRYPLMFELKVAPEWR